VSETEGLPVSMMEAISFGVPILATDVGGCNEIVTIETGILIPKDFQPELVAMEISKFKDSQKNEIVFRQNVKEFWKKNFECSNNFKQFLNLTGIHT
jgi:glycosyltransferase involved in cell wall biosynthesis